MVYFERRALLGIVHTMIVAVLFYFLYLQPNLVGNTVVDVKAWSLALLLYLAFSIGTRILLDIIHSIIHGMLRKLTI